MKHYFQILFITLTVIFMSCDYKAPYYKSVDEYPVYEGNDLGAVYSANQTDFCLWSPAASEVKLRIYDAGNGGEPVLEKNMKSVEQGSWKLSLSGDWKNKYYTFQVRFDTVWKDETTDIYAKGVGVNGQRGMIVDFTETNPEGWNNELKPALKSFSDIILYELHVRDLSMHENSGIKNKGKYLAFTEKNTEGPKGEKTGIDHIVELGVTHVHLLPVFDFKSIDETNLQDSKYNWGYDPQNYNSPEGSYSTNPFDGKVRIKEFKEMVKSLHANGLRVVMDVVYNHTGLTEKSNFEQLVPGYYYRKKADGTFSNASGCGNETASERPMMRKFIIESIKFWIKEYHIDGFRFDLMGIHDIETMNNLRAEIDKIDSSIFVYGEGWTGGDCPLPAEQRCVKENAYKLNRIAVFSDDVRDGIKGHWSDVRDRGFVSGKKGLEESVKFGIVGAVNHLQIKFDSVNYAKKAYSNEPTQTIVYVSCHDNPTLWDKLHYSCPTEKESEYIKMQKLANAIVLTSQGVPFLHAGEEFARTKFGVENSYQSPDSINRLDWNRKAKFKDVFDFYKKLIALRKNHPAFRMPTTEMLNKHLLFLEMKKTLLVGYQLTENANQDKWKNILVFFNSNKDIVTVDLPEGEWVIVVNGDEVDETGVKKNVLNNVRKKQAQILGRSMMMLVDKESL